MRSALPPIIKNYLKAAPAVWVGMVFLVGTPVLINIQNYRMHERNPKICVKSNQVEKYYRKRDSKFRNHVYPLLTNQPGDKPVKPFIIE